MGGSLSRHIQLRPGVMDSGLAPSGAPQNDKWRESPNKNPGIAAGVFAFRELGERGPGSAEWHEGCRTASRTSWDQKSMPPMPPPGGMPPPPAPWFFFGSSATMASVVIRRAATEAAFWIAARTTLVGSMMPLVIRLPYSPVWESKP